MKIFQRELIWISLSTLLSLLSHASSQGSHNPYRHFEILDPDGKFILEWEVNWLQKRITFNTTVQTRGYVALGLSARGQINGADIVVGGVTRYGKAYFSDRHGVGDDVEPEIDSSQDWDLHSAWENGSHTFLSFSRAFDTCDDEHDYKISEGNNTALIWAYGDSDHSSDFLRGHGTIIGLHNEYLLDPDHTPRPLKEESFRPGPPSKNALGNLKVWTISTKFQLPQKHTTYVCSMHKAPRLPEKHHIVASHTRLETQSAYNHTHHLSIFRCTPPPNTDPTQFFERYLNIPGEECYFLTRPTGQIPTQYCTSVVAGYTIGAKISFSPGHVGMPFGGSLGDYYLIQVHYDNIHLKKDVEFEINYDFYYTNQLRENDVGFVTVGHHIPGSPSLLVPPGSTNHHIFGHCSSDCTRSMLPPEGINLLTFVQHTHTSGKKFKIHHFRGNTELPWIVNDENFNPFFQNNRRLHNERKVLPGDQITIECEYDNTWMNGTTVGGFSTMQEMCLSYFVYYSPQLSSPIPPLCRSDLVSQEYRRKYLGITNVTWDYGQLDFVATSPLHLRGMSMAQISDNVNWSPRLREDLELDHKWMMQEGACSHSPFSSAGQGQVVQGETTYPIAYPVGITEYVPPVVNTCNNVRRKGSSEWRGWRPVDYAGLAL